MRYDTTLIMTGLLYLLVGQGIGIWMGIGQDFTYAPAHAHVNLVGGVTLCLYGLAHRAYPALAKSRIALAQALLAIASALVFPAGIAHAIATQNPVVAMVGAFGIVLSTLMFAIMVLRHAGKT